LNWGRIEFHLHAVLLPVDRKRAQKWIVDFFHSTNISYKEKKLKQELKDLAEKSHPEWLPVLDNALDDFAHLRQKRNPLIHGTWHRVSDGRFSVQPLRLNGSELVDPVVVDIQYLSNVVKVMENVIGRCASLGTETLSNEWLRKMGRST